VLGIGAEGPTPGLYWGIKASFFAYIRGMPDGSASVGAGARPVSGGAIAFARHESGDPASSQALRFRGEVHFTGHFGLLSLVIADPIVELADDRAILSVRTVTAESGSHTPLVTFLPDVDDSLSRVRIISAGDVRLLEQGTDLFNNSYPPGEPFDPILVVEPRASTPGAGHADETTGPKSSPSRREWGGRAVGQDAPSRGGK
jgi:hypothetical protein